MRQERVFALSTASFSVPALVLACVGIYGVMAYSVAQRTTEIDVRLAIGALPVKYWPWCCEKAMTILMAGVAIGLTTAVLLSPLVKSLLYGLRPHNPVVFISAALLLALVGLAASSIPARRASVVEPIEALRQD